MISSSSADSRRCVQNTTLEDLFVHWMEKLTAAFGLGQTISRHPRIVGYIYESQHRPVLRDDLEYLYNTPARPYIVRGVDDLRSHSPVLWSDLAALLQGRAYSFALPDKVRW